MRMYKRRENWSGGRCFFNSRMTCDADMKAKTMTDNVVMPAKNMKHPLVNPPTSSFDA